MHHNLKTSVRITAVSALILPSAIGCATPAYMPSSTAEKRAPGLINAVAAGDLVQFKSFIAAGTDGNAKNNNGDTALMYAVSGDHAEVVEALLAAKADVNAKTNDVAWHARR